MWRFVFRLGMGRNDRKGRFADDPARQPASLQSSPKMVAVLYTRRGCRLCEEAEDLLAHHGWNLDLVDVDADVALRARFGDRVPVLEVDGRVVAEGRFNEATLPAREGTAPPSSDRPRRWWGLRER